MAFANGNFFEGSPAWNLLAWHIVSARSLLKVDLLFIPLSVMIVSIIRLSLLLKLNLTSPDISYEFVSVAAWSIVECNICIVCGKSPLPSSHNGTY